jgi:hypothetical protein
MNTQIRKLIRNLDNENGRYYWTDKDKEKFALLIIQECMNKIENEASQYAEPVWVVELINDIKDHFGVEE